MRAIFLADAHLKDEQDENYRLLLRFLDEQCNSIDALFILGDLFEFWLGQRATAFPQYRPVLEKLRQLRAAGIAIHYFEGNHDFHLGRYFTKTIGATVYRSAAILKLDGRKVYACHGDQINHLDIGYRLLRLTLHSRAVGILSHLVPPKITSWIAAWMARSSKRKYRSREARWNYRTILRNFAARRFADGCDTVITGHFHIPLLEQPDSPGNGITVSLGDWIHRYSYAEWDNGSIRLMTYRPQSASLR